MAERKPGFYWVRCRRFPSGEGDWQVALYVFGLWHCVGSEAELTDDDIVESGDRVEREGAARLLEAIKRTRYLEDQLTEILGVLRPPAWPPPHPITDAQKTGERFLVWWNEGLAWVIGWYSDGEWRVTHDPRQWIDGVIHYLPLPPDMKP